MSWSKILELSILEHMLESGEEFKLDKMLDALKS
jgi:hypothetical protein